MWQNEDDDAAAVLPSDAIPTPDIEHAIPMPNVELPLQQGAEPAVPTPDKVLPARVRRLPRSSQARALATMAAAEERGRAVIRAARALAEDLTPIADDDWEDATGDDEEPDAEPDIVDQAALPDGTPDLFRVPSAPAVHLPTSNDVHPHPSAYILYLLVIWLHTALHLPFRGCNVVLVVVAQLLKAANVAVNPPLLQTLPAVMDHLGAEPNFQILPACPTCFELFPPTSPATTKCPRCTIPIFHSVPASSRTPNTKPKPLLSFPTKSIEEQLKDMLCIPGVEDEMDLWRKQARTPGIYEDFFDGRISREIEGPDGLPFFRPGTSPDSAPDNELRVGVTLGVDWSVVSATIP